MFFNLYAFKFKRNEQRLREQIKKLFYYVDPEAPDYSDELAAKYRTIDRYQLLGLAVQRDLISEEEKENFDQLDQDRQRSVLAQAAVESVTAYQFELRKGKSSQPGGEGSNANTPLSDRNEPAEEASQPVDTKVE